MLESMKTEQDMHNLCFAAKDESMRVKKEIYNFAASLAEELRQKIGFKGKIIQIIFLI